MTKIIEKGHLWFYGLIPLIVGILFVAKDFGMQILPAQMGLWSTMVFLFGLVYVIMALGK